MGAPQYEQAGADIGGTGTTNTIPRWTGPSTLGDSLITQSGTLLGVNKAVPTSTVDVDGLQANSSGTSASAPTGTLRLNFAGQPTPGYGASIVFSQQWFAGSPTSYIAVGQITGVKTAAGGSYGGGVALWYSNGGNALVEGMRITDTGNVGIGTASPTGRLHVVGGTAAASTNGAPVTIVAQSGGTGNTNGGSIVLTPGTQAGTGTVGLVDLSGPTGTGLKLPATPGNADTQTLDAYQEGTTTCTATAEGGGTITLTAGSDTLRYTRVGRLVTIDGSLTIDSVNLPTGRLRINTNLGAYPGAAAVGISVRLTGFAAGLATTPIGQCTNVGNVATFQIDRFSGAGNVTTDVAAYAQAGAVIRVSVTFSV